MTYLLDTNVISEFTKPEPATAVIQWLQSQQHHPLHLSVITIGEIQQGIARLPASAKKADLQTWLDDTLLPSYGQHILPLDTDTMLIWGQLTAVLLSQGRRLPVMDGLLAATARQHDLILVTRNTADFADTGVALVNPWLPV